MTEGAKARPWAWADPAELSRCIGVMTDVDDTLTRDGVIEPMALDALHALQVAGIAVIAVTGRPMGWSEPFALAWPVAAIVAENGAVALRRGAPASTASCTAADALHVDYIQDAVTRERNARRLREVAQRIVREVPAATLARDSAGRVTDIAIDHAEFAALGPAQIERVVAIMREEGMTATVSSIHINGWFGTHDKWQGAQWIVQMAFGRSLAAEVDRWVYVGDSTNDQVMFDRFRLSVGVANLRHFAAQLRTWPAFLTDGERGAGFAEVARALLRAHPRGGNQHGT